MTKIKNTTAYIIKRPLALTDYAIGTNSENVEVGMALGKSISMQLSDVFTLFQESLTPVEGGILKITEIEIDTLDTDIATTVNALDPAYTVSPYETVFFNVAGQIFLLKVVDTTIGTGQTALTNDDFIEFPVSVGATGNGIASIVLLSTVGLVKTYRITYTNAGTFDFAVTDGDVGDNGLSSDMTRTSITSIAIASSGSKTLNYTASTNLGWANGTRLRFANSISNYMEGVVTSVSSTSVTITVDNSLGSGTFASWTISVAGDKGQAGSIEDVNFSNSATTTFSGAGTVVDPYKVNVTKLQKTITSDTTLSSADDNYSIIINNGATPIEITVPTGLPTKFCAGFTQQGSADVTFVASSTTINNPTGLKIKGQYYAVCLEKVDTSTVFQLTGDTKT